MDLFFQISFGAQKVKAEISSNWALINWNLYSAWKVVESGGYYLQVEM